MYLDIKKIGEEPVPFDHALDISGLTSADSLLLGVREVRLEGRVWRGERGVDLQGRLTATVELACGRCLEGFETTVSEDFFLTMVAQAPEFRSGETEVTEEDALLYYAKDGRADLREIAREQLILALPLKAVCRDACQGLCPTCGANRNRLECGCPSQDLDPRLAPLLQFKRKMGDS